MEQEQKLGIKVFFYYFYKKILFGILFLIISIIILSLKDALILKMASFFSYLLAEKIINLLIVGLFIFSFLVLAIGIISSWLNYINCTFILDDVSLIIKRGILSKKIISIPYRQIQDINIEQTFSNRLMGICKFVILTAGNDNKDIEGESEGIFKVIDINIAKNLQNTILQKK